MLKFYRKNSVCHKLQSVASELNDLTRDTINIIDSSEKLYEIKNVSNEKIVLLLILLQGLFRIIFKNLVKIIHYSSV